MKKQKTRDKAMLTNKVEGLFVPHDMIPYFEPAHVHLLSNHGFNSKRKNINWSYIYNPICC